MKKLLIATAMIVCATTANAQWNLTNQKDMVTLKSDPYISTFASYSDSKYGTKPFMGVNCNSIYFGGLDTLSSGVYWFRTDSMSEAKTVYGQEWQGYGGVTLKFAYSDSDRKKFWKKAEGHFQNMIRDDKLFAKFDSYSRSNQSAVFKLTGLRKN